MPAEGAYPPSRSRGTKSAQEGKPPQPVLRSMRIVYTTIVTCLLIQKEPRCISADRGSAAPCDWDLGKAGLHSAPGVVHLCYSRLPSPTWILHTYPTSQPDLFTEVSVLNPPKVFSEPSVGSGTHQATQVSRKLSRGEGPGPQLCSHLPISGTTSSARGPASPCRAREL